jgi:hypothetical protein
MVFSGWPHLPVPCVETQKGTTKPLSAHSFSFLVRHKPGISLAEWQNYIQLRITTHLYVNIRLRLSSPCAFFLTEHHAMKVYWGSGGIAQRILDLDTRWRWVVSLTPRPLYPRERAPGTHWIGGWGGGPREKFPVTTETRTPIIQPVAQRYTTELSRLLYVYTRGCIQKFRDWIIMK